MDEAEDSQAQQWADQGKCPECGGEVEAGRGAYESRGEFWGAPCSEYMVYSVICKKCGAETDI